MKNKLFWLALIVGTLALIGSCKKSDDTTATATTAGCAGSGITETTCSTSASGTITGIAGDNSSVSLSGIFSPYHYYGHTGINGVDNATDCIDNATIIASQSPPTGANSMISNRAITSSSSFSDRRFFYSDSSCSTEIVKHSFGYTGLTVGDNVTSLDTSVGDSTYPSDATKVTYTQTCKNIKASSDAGVTYLKNFYSDIESFDPQSGTTYQCEISGHSADYALWHIVDSSVAGSGLDSLVFEEGSSGYPDNWSSSANTYTKLP